MIELDKIGDFSAMTQYYEGWIKLFNRLRPSMSNPKEGNSYVSKKMLDPTSMIRSSIMNISLHLLSLEQEQLTAMQDESNPEQKRKMKEVQEEIIRQVDSFKKVMVYPGKTGRDADKFFQFRNILAHSNFTISLKDFEKTKEGIDFGSSNIYIKFDNGKIHGEISYTDLLMLEYSYEIASDVMDFRKPQRYISVIDENTGEIKLKKFEIIASKNKINSELQEKTICQLEEYREAFDEDQEITKNLNLKHELFDINYMSLKEVEVSEEDNKIFKELISFIGESNWKKMKPQYKYQFLNDYLLNNEHKKTGITIKMLMGLRSYNNVDSLNRKFNLLEQDFYEGPLYYSNTLLEYAYYCFGYIREINAKEESNIFFHRNIPFDGIDMTLHTGEELIKIKKKSTRLNEQKQRLSDEIKDTLDDMFKVLETNNLSSREPNKDEKNRISKENLKDKKLDGIYDAVSEKVAKNKGIGKQEVKEKVKYFLENKYSYSELNSTDREILKDLKNVIKKFKNNEPQYRRSQLNPKLYKIEKELDKVTQNPNLDKYSDSSAVFRSLRNSINHGNFKIDYSKALKNGNTDFSKIMFTFRDYNPETKALEFEMKNISAGRLLNLIKDFNRSIERDAQDTGKEYLMKNILLNEGLRREKVGFTETGRVPRLLNLVEREDNQQGE